MAEYITILQKIAKNDLREDKLELIDVFLGFQDDFIKPYKNKGVPDDDLRQECALVISEIILADPFISDESRERILAEGEAVINEIYKELIHRVSKGCDDALSDLTGEEESAKQIGLEILAKVNSVNDKALAFKEEYGFAATPKELSEYSGFSEDEIINAVELSGYEIKDILWQE